MELKRVEFNGVDLSRFIFIEEVRKKLYNDTNIIVEVDFTIINDDLQNVIDELNKIIHTVDPAYLSYSELPDRKLYCRLDKEIKHERFKNTIRGTLTFKGEYNYWISDKGIKMYELDGLNQFTIDNEGTAPTKPVFEFEMLGEAGYIQVVGPDGYTQLGEREELDKVELPEQEVLINDTLTSIGQWVNVTTSGELLIPDYNKLSIGTNTFNYKADGLYLNKSTNPKAGYYWNTKADSRTFDTSSLTGLNAYDNFKIESKLSMFDTSGGTKNTGMFLLVVMDKDNRPIMTTSIYNISSDNNEVIVTTKLNTGTGDRKSSRILKQFKFVNGINGLIRMTRENGVYSWVIDSGRAQKNSYYKDETVTSVALKEGATVYIKDSARYGYHHDGTAYGIAGFTRGRAHTITNTRSFRGSTQYMISYQGTPIYWMYGSDLTVSISQVTERKLITYYDPTVQTYSYTDNSINDLKASKMLLVGGTWDSSNPFDNASVKNIKGWGLNGTDSFLEIRNTFQQGDIITINHLTGEVLQNNLPFNGRVDNSSWWGIGSGPSDIQVGFSDWSLGAEGNIYFEERFR